MRELHVDWPTLWQQIVLVVLKTLYCVQDVIPANTNSFELFGFDVLIDSGVCVRERERARVRDSERVC